MTQWNEGFSLDGLVDLHIHTSASDGTLTPRELIQEITNKKLTLFSITDHDSVTNIEEMKSLACENEIAFIPGVEISVSHGEQELHILTYGVDPEDFRVLDILKYNQNIRESHNSKLIKFVCESYENITFDMYENYVNNPKSGGWKALNFLISKGVTESINDFFSLIDDFGLPLKFESFDVIIPKLKACGYTLILAHPSAYFGGERLPVILLDALINLGVQGIECFSPYFNNSSDQAFYINYCKENDLLITSGSDYHGSFIKNRKLAIPETPLREISQSLLRLVTK